MKTNKFLRSILIFVILCSFVMCTMLSAAAAVTSDVSSSSTDSTSPRGVYIRELVGYDANINNVDLRHTPCGRATGTNNGSGVLTITYIYSTSGSVSASFSSNVNTSIKKNMVVAEVSGEVGFNLGLSKTWTKGTSSGATYQLTEPGTAYINAYIPGVTTNGSLVYKVWMDGYEDNWWYEYETVSNAMMPVTDWVHLEAGDC